MSNANRALTGILDHQAVEIDRIGNRAESIAGTDRKENREFIDAWRRFTGQPKAMTNDSMQATWIGFHLWTEAVEAASSTELHKVRAALGGRQIAAPSGFTVKMDGKSHHLYKPVMIGRITTDGLIVPVSITDGLVPPEPWSPWLAEPKASKAA